MFGIGKLKKRIEKMEARAEKKETEEDAKAIIDACKNGSHKWLLGYELVTNSYVYPYEDSNKPYIRCEHCFKRYEKPEDPLPRHCVEALKKSKVSASKKRGYKKGNK